MLGELGVDQAAQLRVHRRQHLGQLLDLGDGHPPGRQGIGHLQPDVPGADDDRTGRRGLLQGAHQRERVAHGVQQVHPVSGAQRAGPAQALDRGLDRDRASANKQFVVRDQLLGPGEIGDQELAVGDLDAAGRGVQAQLHAGCLEVGDRAVGEVAPVGDLAGDVVRDPADGEVGVGVGDDHRHLGCAVELAGPQRGADARVAAADGNQVHGTPIR